MNKKLNLLLTSISCAMAEKAKTAKNQANDEELDVYSMMFSQITGIPVELLKKDKKTRKEIKKLLLDVSK